MARTATAYQRLIYVFENAAVFMPLLMIVLGLLVRQGYTDQRFYSDDLTFGFILGGYILVLAISLSIKHPTKLVTAFFSVAFHVLIALYMLFISGFLTVFLAVWIFFMISIEVRFGKRGFVLSFLGLCGTAIGFMVMYPIQVSERVELAEGALAVGVMAFVISMILATTKHEQTRLAETRELEIYQRDRLMALINGMGDAVVGTNETGLIKVYNSTFLNMLDTNLDLTGKPLTSLLNLRDGDNTKINIIEEAEKQRHVFSRDDLAHYFPDGDRIRLYINVAPISPGYRSRTERGFIFILRDITKQKSLDDERDEFISVVSHELRTPVAIAEGELSNIKLMFERKIDPTTIASAVEQAHEQSVYLAKLINDLSTLARAEHHAANTNETIQLAEFLQDLYHTYEPQAKAKKLALNLDMAPKLGGVTTSKLYLQEILQNLITNALKYTSEGSVLIRGTRTRDFVAISIADTGIGISKTDQKRIFHKFYRSEDYRTRESSGTGMGLYVCKKLAEKIGLKIELESRLNHGSTFTVIIPVSVVIGSSDDAAAATPDNTRSDPSS